jgi:hypothetical protein
MNSNNIMYGLNLERRILDKILHAVDSSDDPGTVIDAFH